MAEDLERLDRSVPTVQLEGRAPAAEAPLVDRPPSRVRALYRGRFALAYVALGLVAAASAAVTVLLQERSPDTPTLAWSDWRPLGDEATYPRQIADHVAQNYRLPNGNQFVAVLRAGPPVAVTGDGTFPVGAVAMRGSDGDVDVVNVEDDVMYTLCGAGAQCAMTGRSTVERGMLLRREALELALYTFKYTSADSVITLLPPRVTVGESGEAEALLRALFFRERDFRQELSVPLRQTLVSAQPRLGALAPHELTLVDRLTEPHAFQYQYTQAPDGSALLLLVPFGFSD